MTERRYRIFISSPSDVRPERAIAERVIAKLAREFSHHCRIEAVLWEREPLVATGHFQDAQNIPPPSSTDICVVVLWSRLGVPLPEAEFKGPLSGRPVTGTEWEFEDALKSYRERQLPDLLVYQKDADIVASLSDEAALEELRRQKRLLADFLARWFKSADGASFTAASHGFTTTTEFEDRLEEHLRTLLKRRLETDLGLVSDADAITWTEAPWPSLGSFEVGQAPIFFGRTRARNELRELLTSQIATDKAFVLVIGASGSGKSSLVKAGLLPDLMLPGMVGDVGLVRYGIMKPGDAGGDTIRALAESILAETALPELRELEYTAEALALQLRQNAGQIAFVIRQGLARAGAETLTARGEARLAIVVDQLEELFTLDSISQAQREHFVASLAVLARSGLAWVIATIRADFFDRLELLPELAELSDGGRYLLLPPNLAELSQIVRRPARAAGLRFEVNPTTGEGLDDAIVHAAARDPGALPLLSFALDRLWREPREGGTLSFAAYAALGELDGAIAHHAESVVADLPDAAKAALPGLLGSLVTLRETDQQATSRPSRYEALIGRAGAAPVLDRLIQARLLIADETAQGVSVRLAHEALVRSWPRLAAIIEDNREALATIARLRIGLAEWQHHGQPPDLLLPPGKRLSDGAQLLDERRGELDADLAGFIDASRRGAAAAIRRRRGLVLGAFATLSILAIAAGIGAWFGFAGQQSAIASRNAFERQFEAAEQARTQNLAEALKNETNPKIIEAVALSALQRRGPASEAKPEEALLDRLVVAANADRQRLVLAHDDEVRAASYSADGTRIVTASEDGVARIWDARLGTLLLALHGHEGPVYCAAFSPDGRLIVTASADKTARIWDATNGALLTTLAGHQDRVLRAAFSPDGKQVVTASNDLTARIWDVATGAEQQVLAGHGAAVMSAAFSPDGTTILTASRDATARVWTTGGRLLTILKDHALELNSAAFSPDGRRIVTGSLDQTARIWDAASGSTVVTLAGHTGLINRAEFSPDGRRVATASLDGTARIWDAASGALLMILSGHEGEVSGATFNPDGSELITSSLDGTARVWDVTAGALLKILSGHRSTVESAVYSPDGQRILTASDDKTARIWDAASGTDLVDMIGHTINLMNAVFSPDGQRVATSSIDRTARLWDAASGKELVTLAGHAGAVTDVAFSPDGRRVATASHDQTARIWDVQSGSLLKQLDGHRERVTEVAFSPDGKRLLTSSDDQTIRIWDAQTGAALGQLSGHNAGINDVAFSPDGRRIVSSSTDKTSEIRDADSGAVLATLIGHESDVVSGRFSPDGSLIATGSYDSTARIWDAATGAPLMILTGHVGDVNSAEFSPDGHRLVTSSADKTARIWDVPDYLKRGDLGFIRAIASHDLNAAIRARYALPPPPAPAHAAASRCAPPSEIIGEAPDAPTLAAWNRAAADGDAICDQLLAARAERPGPERDLEAAFYLHALAARLFEAGGMEDSAQQERYRREALAWLLPRQRVERLIEEADEWHPGQPADP